MTIRILRRKRRRAKQGRKRQLRLFRRAGKVGHSKRAGILGRQARELTALIQRQIRQGRIDWNGCEPLPLSRRKTRRALRWVLDQDLGVYVSSTVRYDSVTYHGPSQRRAVDLGSDDPSERPERRAQRALFNRFGAAYFLELFGPENGPWVKNGVSYVATEGEYLETLHDNHTHFAA